MALTAWPVVFMGGLVTWMQAQGRFLKRGGSVCDI